MITNYSFYDVNTHMNKIYITLKIILKIKLFYEFSVLKKSFLPRTSISTDWKNKGIFSLQFYILRSGKTNSFRLTFYV